MIILVVGFADKAVPATYEKYYNLDDVASSGAQSTINVQEDIDVEGLFPPLKEVNRTIQRLHLADYSPLKYVLPEKRNEYNKKYDIEVEGGSIFKQLDREESLIHLMRINLLKRMESSINSFAITIGKLLTAVNLLLEKIEKYDAMVDVDELNINDIEIDSDLLADLLIGNKVKVLIQDCDTIRWKQELEADCDQLVKLLHAAQQITPDRDKKLQALKELIRQKITMPLNPGNRKVIIFTAFADTATYLYRQLYTWANKEFGIHSGLVVGTGTNQTTLRGIRTDIHSILTNFLLRSALRTHQQRN